MYPWHKKISRKIHFPSAAAFLQNHSIASSPISPSAFKNLSLLYDKSSWHQHFIWRKTKKEKSLLMFSLSEKCNNFFFFLFHFMSPILENWIERNVLRWIISTCVFAWSTGVKKLRASLSLLESGNLWAHKIPHAINNIPKSSSPSIIHKFSCDIIKQPFLPPPPSPPSAWKRFLNFTFLRFKEQLKYWCKLELQHTQSFHKGR